MKIFLFIMISICTISSFSQENEVKFALHDGVVIGGYVDHGGFLNFTVPNINIGDGNSKFMLGMLPSLRIKKDNGTPRNAYITPNLGAGFTYIHKFLAIQLPLYYNAKTASENGRWHLGLGVGIRINGFTKTN